MPGLGFGPRVAPGIKGPGLSLRDRITQVGGPTVDRRFWVGTGTWATAANWSKTSGGSGGAGAPTAAMEAVFDQNSGSGTCTVGAAAVCRSLDMAGLSPSFTFAGTFGISIGDATLPTNAVALRLSPCNFTYSGTITFASTNLFQQVIKTNSVGLLGPVTFNGIGGSWRLADALTTTGALTVTRGSFDDGGFGGSWSSLVSTTAAARSITISGNVTITLSTTVLNFSNVALLTTNMTGTFTATNVGSAGAFNGAGMAVGSWIFTSANPTVVMTGANTFINLVYVPATGTTNNRLVLTSSITVTGLFWSVGKDNFRFRNLVTSATLGSSVTITAASVLLANNDFQDIAGAGAAAPFTGTSMGDFLGNSGITFDASVTNYWVGGTGNWDDVTHWASTPGGVGGTGRAPLPQDDCVVNASSGAGTISIRQARLGRNLDLTNASVDVSTVQSIVGLGYSITGNFALMFNTLWTQAINNTPSTDWHLRGRGAHTLTLNGSDWATGIVEIATPTGTYTLQDSGAMRTLNLVSGTLSVVAAPKTLSLSAISTSAGTTWNGGTATWSAPSITFVGTFNPGTSILELAGAGALTNNTGGTLTVWDVHVTAASSSYFLGANGFVVHDYTVVAGATVGNFVGMTVTFSSITVNGTSGSPVIISNSLQFTWSCDGTVTVTYANIDHCIAAGASIPFHDVNGVDNGNNVNWLFDQLVSISDGEGVTDNTATTVASSIGEASALTDSPVVGPDVSAGDPLGGSDLISGAAVGVVGEPLGVSDTSTASAEMSVGDLLGETDSTSGAATTVVGDSLGETDNVESGFTVEVGDGLGESDVVVVSGNVQPGDLLGEVDAVSSEVAGVIGDLLPESDEVSSNVTVAVENLLDETDVLVVSGDVLLGEALPTTDSINGAVDAVVGEPVGITELLSMDLEAFVGELLELTDDVEAVVVIAAILLCLDLVIDGPTASIDLSGPSASIVLSGPTLTMVLEEC